MRKAIVILIATFAIVLYRYSHDVAVGHQASVQSSSTAGFESVELIGIMPNASLVILDEVMEDHPSE